MDKIELLKESSSSIDVEAATKPSQKSKRESDGSERVILKKHRQEFDEFTKSLKEISEAVKTLQENSLTKADLEEILLKVKETPNKKVVLIHECCLEASGAKGNNRDTIFVRGFDRSLPRDIIKTTLMTHFGSCGEITRVFVPFQCLTGFPLGYAFINLRRDEHLTRDTHKALSLHGSYLGGFKLEVVMKIDSEAYSYYPNFRGCKRCITACRQRRFDSFYKTIRIPFHLEGDSDKSSKDDQEAMNTNFWGPVYTTHFAIPHLKKTKGKIVAVASPAGWSRVPRMSIYAASKAAMINFYETLRIELGPEVGITIVFPDLIENGNTNPDLLAEKQEWSQVVAIESAGECAKAIINEICRGKTFVAEPSWVVSSSGSVLSVLNI